MKVKAKFKEVGGRIIEKEFTIDECSTLFSLITKKKIEKITNFICNYNTIYNKHLLLISIESKEEI